MTRASKRRRRRNLDAPEPMEDLLERAGEDRFSKVRSPIPRKQWRAAVGPRIADRAQPMTLERKVLVVKVATSVWANELQMLAPELVARLRLHGVDVESLRFRTGPLDLPERPPERRATRKVPPPAKLDAPLRAVVDAVVDDELRKSIEQAARANLAWQAHLARPARPARVSGAPPGARAPRDAGRESAPPAHRSGASAEASPGSHGGAGGRRR